MINKIDSILSLNILVLIVVNISAINITKANNNVNKSEIGLKESQHQFMSTTARSRALRGAYYYSQPFFDHEYHASLPEPQYIVNVVAPRRRDRDPGVRELLLVLAPLAAIPLIGSVALTTFTTLFATGGIGRRRKRDLLTRELLSRSFTEVQNKDNDYVNHKQIGSQHNVGLESLLATSASTGSSNANINANDKRHIFSTNDFIREPNIGFGSQMTPKSQLIAVNEELNNWQPIDTFANERTGVQKSSPIMSNTSALTENKEYKGIESTVKGFAKRFRQTISSDETHRHIDESLGKRQPLEMDRTEQSAQVEPIQRQQYKSSVVKSTYLKKTDLRPDPIVSKNDNKSEKQSIKSEENNRFVNNVNKNYNNFRDLGLEFGTDLNTGETHANTKPIIESSNNGNKPKSDGFEYNTWIPFLSNPYLAEMTRGEGKREIQELDVIQKYLSAMGRPDYNDEIIATYLSCNGMLSAGNQCLERLTCQFSDASSAMKVLEKDVSALVIYSLLKNQHIDNGFKSRLQRAAFHGKDNPGKCHYYNCLKNNVKI